MKPSNTDQLLNTEPYKKLLEKHLECIKKIIERCGDSSLGVWGYNQRIAVEFQAIKVISKKLGLELTTYDGEPSTYIGYIIGEIELYLESDPVHDKAIADLIEYLDNSLLVPEPTLSKQQEQLILSKQQKSQQIAEFFTEHLDKLDWYWVSGNSALPVEFFEKHLDKLNPKAISQNRSIPTWFFEKYPHLIDWAVIAENPSISMDFLRENSAKLKWNNISYNKSLTIEFLRENRHKLDWYWISRRGVHLEFFKENLDLIDWKGLSRNTFGL